MDELESWVRTASPRIWERRPSDPDALRPTIGTGRRPLGSHGTARASDSPLIVELDAVTSWHATVDRVPVIGPGPETGSLGITGDADHVRSLLARIIVEAAMLHPPTQLRIWVAAVAPGWEWCRWLPHVAGGGPSSDAAEASALLAAAAREVRESGSGPLDTLHLIVVPEASRRVDVAALESLSGAHSWSSAARTVETCRAAWRSCSTSTVMAAESVVGHYGDAPLGDVFVDGIGEDRAERMAIALGRLGGRTGKSAPSGLVELLGLGSATTPDVLGAWRPPPSDR